MVVVFGQSFMPMLRPYIATLKANKFDNLAIVLEVTLRKPSTDNLEKLKSTQQTYCGGVDTTP